MFDKELFADALREYKSNFSELWEHEKYKWQAVKCFQEHFDIEAENFPEMLTAALTTTGKLSLLESAGNFPKGMLLHFAETDSENVRQMFMDLYDENQELYQRIDNFKKKSNECLKMWNQYKGRNDKNHYQNENSIMTYLWLRYPEKYYIYKFTEIKSVAEKLNAGYTFKQGAYKNNIQQFMFFYDELNEELKKDDELVSLFNSMLTEDCYTDPELKTLTIDFGFYVSRYYMESDDKRETTNHSEWVGEDYNPGLSVEDWLKLLNNSNVFKRDSLEIMKRIKDYGGEASCKQLSLKYGGTNNFYNTGSSSLAKRIVKATDVQPQIREDNSVRWWSILYIGRDADGKETGSFIWKLRDELSEALDMVDLSNVNLYVYDKENTYTKSYFPKNNNIANEEGWFGREYKTVLSVDEWTELLSDKKVFKTESLEIMKRMKDCGGIASCKQLSMKYGGTINFYNNGTRTLAKRVLSKKGIIVDPQKDPTMRWWNTILFLSCDTEKNEEGSYKWKLRDELSEALDMVDLSNVKLYVYDKENTYTKKHFLKDVYLSEKDYDRLKAILLRKKNIILQGAPGVGKTFAAKRLAYSIMGEKNDSRIEFVQFHQNYSYEDFVMGYKPAGDTFKLDEGIFYTFCEKAEKGPDNEYFFIIDEINRGNMSKIFGELLMLIECEHRNDEVTLAYSKKPFHIPENLYIIGMMNTADRSLAMIDYALRRRFSFFEMIPAFDSDGFKNYQSSLKNDKFDSLIEKIKLLNNQIENDDSLGKGFCIGHSYFCNITECTDELLNEIVEYEILPMLNEYWFDSRSDIEKWESELRGVLK